MVINHLIDTEEAHESAKKFFGAISSPNKYFRINVPNLGEFSLDASEHLDHFINETNKYLETKEGKTILHNILERFSKKIKN